MHFKRNYWYSVTILRLTQFVWNAHSSRNGGSSLTIVDSANHDPTNNPGGFITVTSFRYTELLCDAISASL